MDWTGKKSQHYLGGPMILQKADDFAQRLGYSATFKCSTGWLGRFKHILDLVFKKVCGESGKVTSEMTTEWTPTNLPTLLSEYRLDDA